MKYLSIDFGLAHIGLAVSFGSFAEPFGEISNKDPGTALGKIKSICREEKIEQIIVGISEGGMAEKTKEFAKTLKKAIDLPIVFQDETLTSSLAKTKMIEAGTGRKKRSCDHKIAAALILQAFLDSL